MLMMSLFILKLSTLFAMMSLVAGHKRNTEHEETVINCYLVELFLEKGNVGGTQNVFSVFLNYFETDWDAFFQWVVQHQVGRHGVVPEDVVKWLDGG